jgi:hypothetical protein
MGAGSLPEKEAINSNVKSNLEADLIADVTKWRSLYENEAEQNESEGNVLIAKKKLVITLEKRVKSLTAALSQAEAAATIAGEHHTAAMAALQETVNTNMEASTKWKLLYENEVDQNDAHETHLETHKTRLNEFESQVSASREEITALSALNRAQREALEALENKVRELIVALAVAEENTNSVIFMSRMFQRMSP